VIVVSLFLLANARGPLYEEKLEFRVEHASEYVDAICKFLIILLITYNYYSITSS
jgi:hypothetical protein